MANTLHQTGNTIEEVVAADVTDGQFEFTASGIAKFFTKDAVAGQLTAAHVGNVTYAVDKDSATDVYALGADVFGDETAQTALTAAGDGQLGYAAAASANGDLQVMVRLTN
jgi:predicted RecA/RadA family phage recombinase